MHAPNPRFRFKQVPADAHTYTQALALVHTHTHACRNTRLINVEYACPESTFCVFDSGKCLRRYTNTHTHTHTRRMLVYAHKLYAPAFTCTHQNDVMYACPKSTFSVQGNASKCIHVRTDTRTPPYTNILLPAT